jgi:hypothetical protein
MCRSFSFAYSLLGGGGIVKSSRQYMKKNSFGTYGIQQHPAKKKIYNFYIADLHNLNISFSEIHE